MLVMLEASASFNGSLAALRKVWNTVAARRMRYVSSVGPWCRPHGFSQILFGVVRAHESPVLFVCGVLSGPNQGML